MRLGSPTAPDDLLEAKLIYSFTKSIKVDKCLGGSALKLFKKNNPFSARSFKSYAKQL